MVHITSVVVEIVASVTWMISIDRSQPGRLIYRVGKAWLDPRNRAAMVAAGRKLMTEDERQATRAAFGLSPEPMDDPSTVGEALPDTTAGLWKIAPPPA